MDCATSISKYIQECLMQKVSFLGACCPEKPALMEYPPLSMMNVSDMLLCTGILAHTWSETDKCKFIL